MNKDGPMREYITTGDFDLTDELTMLLDAVAKVAAQNNLSDASEIIANDKYAQAHFAVVSSILKEISGEDAALIEYGPEPNKLRKRLINFVRVSSMKWPVLNRIV